MSPALYKPTRPFTDQVIDDLTYCKLYCQKKSLFMIVSFVHSVSSVVQRGSWFLYSCVKQNPGQSFCSSIKINWTTKKINLALLGFRIRKINSAWILLEWDWLHKFERGLNDLCSCMQSSKMWQWIKHFLNHRCYFTRHTQNLLELI